MQALCKKALALDPDYPQACREWGSLLLEDGKGEVAGAYLEKAWSEGEEDVPAGILYALHLIASKRESEAIQLLQDLAGKEMSPRERTSILFNLGRCYRRLRNTTEAVGHLRRALEVDPGYVQIFKELFSIYMESEDLRAALECSEKITMIQPGNVEAMNDMGVLLFTLGRKEEAFEVLKTAVALNGSFRDALENLQQVAESLGFRTDLEPARNLLSGGNERG